MQKIDCRGLACPEPVIKTKKALESYSQVETIVDNTTALANLQKLGKKLGCTVEVSDEGNDIFRVSIARDGGEVITEDKGCEAESLSHKVILFASDQFGKGEEELGKILIKGFVYSLTQVDPLPAALIFMNSGVRLATLNDEVKKDLKELDEKGVKILACGTCLDYYNLKDKLEAGSVSNMYEIVETMLAGEVIQI